MEIKLREPKSLMKLSKLGSASQSIARISTDNPFARGVDKVYNTAGKYAKKVYDKFKK